MTTEKHPQWATMHKKPGTELRLIRGKYYLYEYKTVYDKERKGPKKISGKLLGRITEQGLVALRQTKTGAGCGSGYQYQAKL